MRLLEEVNTTKGNAGGCGEAGQVLSLAVLFCLAKISVYAYKKNCKGKGYCKVWVFGYDRKLIKSAADSGFRNMSEVLSYANCMAGDKPVDHIRVSNEARGRCGSYTNYGKMID